jgi:protein SCO1/2
MTTSLRGTIVLLLVLAACGPRRGDRVPAPDLDPPSAPPSAPPAALAAPAAAEPPPSIYELPVRLRDAADQDIGLDVGRGHPVLISMFYASCPVACPVLIDEIGQIAAELPAAVQAELRIVLVSFDPDRDTPAALRELIAARRLDDRWTVASASELDARTIAAVLGFKYRKLDSGEFFHGSTIIALDRDGRPLARTDTLRQRAALLAALR